MAHKVKLWIVLCLLFFALTAAAQQQARPEKMTFTYVDHPAMVNFLVPLIRDTYKKLGIETDFVAQPSNRNLLLVDKNIVDGDVGYMRIVLGGYNNLFTIEPPVVLGVYTILCRPQLICASAVLADKEKTIIATSVSKHGLLQAYKGTIKSQFYTVNDLSLIPEFVRLGRFNYAIYPTTEKELQRMSTGELRYVRLFEANLYHVLHKKYRFMAAEISQALQQTLDERAEK
jgi:hypothetical protein